MSRLGDIERRADGILKEAAKKGTLQGGRVKDKKPAQKKPEMGELNVESLFDDIDLTDRRKKRQEEKASAPASAGEPVSEQAEASRPTAAPVKGKERGKVDEVVPKKTPPAQAKSESRPPEGIGPEKIEPEDVKKNPEKIFELPGKKRLEVFNQMPRVFYKLYSKSPKVFLNAFPKTNRAEVEKMMNYVIFLNNDLRSEMGLLDRNPIAYLNHFPEEKREEILGRLDPKRTREPLWEYLKTGKVPNLDEAKNETAESPSEGKQVPGTSGVQQAVPEKPSAKQQPKKSPAQKPARKPKKNTGAPKQYKGKSVFDVGQGRTEDKTRGSVAPVLQLSRDLDTLFQNASLVNSLSPGVKKGLQKIQTMTENAFRFASDEREAFLGVGKKDVARDLYKTLGKYRLSDLRDMPPEVRQNIESLSNSLKKMFESGQQAAAPGTGVGQQGPQKVQTPAAPQSKTPPAQPGTGVDQQGPQKAQTPAAPQSKVPPVQPGAGAQSTSQGKGDDRSKVMQVFNSRGDYEKLFYRLPPLIKKELDKIGLSPEGHEEFAARTAAADRKLSRVAQSLDSLGYKALSRRLRVASKTLLTAAAGTPVHEIPSIEKVFESHRDPEEFEKSVSELRRTYDELASEVRKFESSYKSSILGRIREGKGDDSSLVERVVELVRDVDRNIESEIRELKKRLS